MAQAQAGSNFLALPDDLRGRLLALIPHDSLTAAALVCRAFHAVISGPQFPALRQRFGGFAAPGPLIVAVTSDYRERPLGTTTCTPRPSPSARDMQVSLSHYRLGFTW